MYKDRMSLSETLKLSRIMSRHCVEKKLRPRAQVFRE